MIKYDRNHIKYDFDEDGGKCHVMPTDKGDELMGGIVYFHCDGETLDIEGTKTAMTITMAVKGDVFEEDGDEHAATLENFTVVGELFDTEEEQDND